LAGAVILRIGWMIGGGRPRQRKMVKYHLLVKLAKNCLTPEKKKWKKINLTKWI
jgi:hypothetical protein